MLPSLRKHIGCTLALGVLIIGNLAHAEARMDVIEFSSRVLLNNPLHDPVVRRVAVFVPDQMTSTARLPAVYYLPGYGGSSDDFIKDAGKWREFTQKLAEEVAPVLLVVVDGRNRWGGSQYLNSSADGNYADYICDEIVPLVEKRYPVAAQHPRRIIAGHSSGGFGALRLGMSQPKLFDGVIALSPDSDFPLSHLPMVKDPAVASLSLAQIESYMAPEMNTALPQAWILTYIIGVSTAYAPVGRSHPGAFQWLYDGEGHLREEVWQRWLDNDPLTIVQHNRNAFQPGQAIYLDGAALDEAKANVGAREIYETLRERPARCTFYEPPGHHVDHLPERLERGLEWIFHRPLQEIR